ncbi:MAG TPA: FecR domain-containing protein [Dongiaceae bacterium]|nr:FecR domain-containing protein [Dongiaceae bacterium]
MGATIRQAAAGAALAVLIAAPAAAEPQIGQVAQKEYLGAAGTRVTGERHDLYWNVDVFAGETVTTGGGATTRLQFLDKTDLYVGANSTVVLDKFVYDPERKIGSGVITLTAGAFRFVSGQIQNKEEIELRTPTVGLVIRGTNLVIFVTEDGTTEVNVNDGEVEALVCDNPRAVAARRGQQLLVTAQCDSSVGNERAVGSTVPSMPEDLSGVAPAAGGDEAGSGHEDKDREQRADSAGGSIGGGIGGGVAPD